MEKRAILVFLSRDALFFVVGGANPDGNGSNYISEQLPGCFFVLVNMS